MITLARCLYAAGVAVSLLAAGVDAAPKPIVSLLNRDLKFDFAGTKIRGVNLGGWLLLEVSPAHPIRVTMRSKYTG